MLPFDHVRESDLMIISRYLDTEINDKVSSDTKILRHQLGIGMPEATGLRKVTYRATLNEIMAWFLEGFKKSSSEEEIIQSITLKNKMI